MQALSQETKAFTRITSFSFSISTFSGAGVLGPFACSAITCWEKLNRSNSNKLMGNLNYDEDLYREQYKLQDAV